MFLEQQIWMISEGSCDTEEWSNDAENSALITEIYYIYYILNVVNFKFTLGNITVYSQAFYVSCSWNMDSFVNSLYLCDLWPLFWQEVSVSLYTAAALHQKGSSFE